MVVVLLMVPLLTLLASFLANDATASFDDRRLPPAAQRSQVPEREAQGAEQEVSGGFARRANFTDREAARSCCEPSRRLDAVERRWSRHVFALVVLSQFELLNRLMTAQEMRPPLRRHFGVGFESTAGVAWPVLPKLSSRWWT